MPLDPNIPDTEDGEVEQPPGDYTAEVRFGVVMYGGVSLAIYINGVTNEIFEMACATPLDGASLIRERDEAPFAATTREIYSRLSWLVGNEALRVEYAMRILEAKRVAAAENAERAKTLWPTATVIEKRDAADCWAGIARDAYTQTRFTVDVVAGTSAGGINGLFLAKALANGERFGPLKDLWINEGDIALLLNDERSYGGVEPPIAARHAQPTSLLNSDRMYAKLYSAMGSMAPVRWVRDDRVISGPSPFVDEIDLYLTTTDIKGSAVPLRLFDKVVYERRFKQNYHFRFPDGVTRTADAATTGNDFAAANRPFMAFAARCTSSFPFAFEPMTLSTVTRLNVPGTELGVAQWNVFFPNLPRDEVTAGAHVHRAFGDGGYLDNKPFSYVAERLAHRFASVPIERKLLFVEPSPEHIDPNDPDRLPQAGKGPDPLQNSLAALTSIPQYETIREDLQAVLTRNRRIERIEKVVRLGETSIDPLHDPFLTKLAEWKEVPDWSTLTVSRMLAFYGTAFIPYLRLRMYAVTDTLADRLCAMAQIDVESDQQYALRALVRVWRERNYHDEGDGKEFETTNAFLDQFDFDYRVRRIGFVLRKVDRLTRLFHKRAAVRPDIARSIADEPPSEEEKQLLDALPGELKGLPGTLPRERLLRVEALLRAMKKGLLESRKALMAASREIDNLDRSDPLEPALREQLDAVLLNILGRTAGESNAAGASDAPPAPMASASLTLQESVVRRAREILDASLGEAPTAIEAWLQARIDALRLKPSRRGPARTGAAAARTAAGSALDRASELAWLLLGSPKYVIEPKAAQARLVVVGEDALALADDGSAGDAVEDAVGVRELLSRYYLRYDTYDQMSFPLYYDTDTGEPSIVEVVRISPLDATNLIDEVRDSRKKLAGTALANFGAFLDRRWRKNDIMWGQLDGCERLIQALLPMTDPHTRIVRDELIELGQRRILSQALGPPGQADLTQLVVDALNNPPATTTVQDRMKGLFDRVWEGNAVARAGMGELMLSLLSGPRLMDFVRYSQKVDPKPDPEATLKSASRAVTITGRVLQVLSQQYGAGEMPSRWLARLGLMVQGIVAVALPGTLNEKWWTHGMKVLYAFEVLLAIFSFVFGSADMRSLAVTALATTFAVHLLTLIAGDIMRGRDRWKRIAVFGLLGVLIGLAGVGALTLLHDAFTIPSCWAASESVGRNAQASWACQQAGSVHEWFRESATPRPK